MKEKEKKRAPLSKDSYHNRNTCTSHDNVSVKK